MTLACDLREQRLIEREAATAGIHAAYALAIARTLTNCQIDYRDRDGRVGVLGVRRDLLPETVVEDAQWLDYPSVNVRTGLRLLRDLLDEHGDWETALHLYYRVTPAHRGNGCKRSIVPRTRRPRSNDCPTGTGGTTSSMILGHVTILVRATMPPGCQSAVDMGAANAAICAAGTVGLQILCTLVSPKPLGKAHRYPIGHDAQDGLRCAPTQEKQRTGMMRIGFQEHPGGTQ